MRSGIPYAKRYPLGQGRREGRDVIAYYCYSGINNFAKNQT
jgi:hypothetical protein